MLIVACSALIRCCLLFAVMDRALCNDVCCFLLAYCCCSSLRRVVMVVRCLSCVVIYVYVSLIVAVCLLCVDCCLLSAVVFCWCVMSVVVGCC